MTWENAINIKLNFEDISRQIIADKTSILFSEEFANFLQAKKISFRYAGNLTDLIQFSEEPETKLLFTSLKEVPAFLSAKADVKRFTLADLPLNAEVRALEQCSISELISLLNYLNATNLLQPITQGNVQQLLQNAKQNANKISIAKLKQEIESLLLKEIHYENILQLGLCLGKFQFAICKSGNTEELKELVSVQQRIDQYTFKYILSGNLKNIFYESGSSVKSVDRIVSSIKNSTAQKIALICFDCMGISEWELLKEYLQTLRVSYKEQQTFALIPSITAISRSAIFYGNHTEIFHLSSINESKALQQQLPDRTCKLFREKDNITSNTLLGVDVAAVIYNFFDNLSHSAQFPPQVENKSLYFDAVKNYLANSNVLQQLRELIEEGYKLFFCSDHGSIVAKGNGKKIEKYLQETFAKRACIIEETTLAEFLNFPQMKIPFVENKLLVLPEGRTMFNNLNSIEISHGGITVDEIVVPFIEVLT
jgi:hypothetical protein